MEDKQRLEAELHTVRKRLHLAEIKLLIAQRWIGLLRQAFDALLHYGVNFKSLDEYLNYPDDADKLAPEKSRDKLLAWIQGVSVGIKAAVRRKSFRLV